VLSASRFRGLGTVRASRAAAHIQPLPSFFEFPSRLGMPA